MKASEPHTIHDVWNDNLEEEMSRIRDVVLKYPYIAMDTEFPGVVARPVGTFKSNTDYHYQTLRCNVDLLKIIQLGLTFSDAEGNLAPGCSTWQFNFKFDLAEDMYAQDSIDLLTRSGIEFEKHQENGIDVLQFGELLMCSGVVLSDSVKWVSFHSGYDFGYLLKILTCTMLPQSEVDFFELLKLYFNVIFDIKHLMLSCDNLKGGLNQVAEDLNVDRIGQMHTAGSDSLLTSAAFFKMRQVYFNGNLDLTHENVLYGLGSCAGNPVPAGCPVPPSQQQQGGQQYQNNPYAAHNQQQVDPTPS